VRALVLKESPLSLGPRTSGRVTLRVRPQNKPLVRRLLARNLVGKLTIRISAVDDSRNVTPFRRVIALTRTRK
jgi:hypothetical protein